MIQIDQNLCVGCLRCLSVCNPVAIEEEEGKAKFHPERRCMGCMHCAAVCPMGAISWDGEPAAEEEIETLEDDLTEQLTRLVRQRRSYRHYREHPVDEDVLREVLELASWAPSAKNQHPVKWIVVQSKETIEGMMDHILAWIEETGQSKEIAEAYARGNNVVMGTAPTLLLAYAPDDAVNPGQDTAIAMTTVELLLQSQGIGTCWGGYLTRMMNAVPALKEEFPLPEGYSFYGSFMMGYPQHEDYLRVPKRLNHADITWK